ncbi:MAG: hypothetical protein DMD91_14520 [Candidatus Rokuibacteriota bacterium]|nr:MAG: hypothetical protein DMD91_14520 [Candidatus Rokubacteria bacterium]
MRRLRIWLLTVVAVVVVLVVVVLIAVPRLVDTPRIQSLIATTTSQSLGRPVKFSGVTISLLPLPSVTLKDLEVAEDPAFGPAPFLKLDEAVVRLRLWPLLLFRVELGDFILKRPIISLVQAPDGRWNITTLGAHAEPRAAGRPRGGSGGSGASTAGALGGRVKVDHGLVTYETRAGGAQARYRVEDLDLTLSGGAVAPLTFKGDFKLKPGDVAVTIADGAVTTNGTRTLADAAVRAKVSVEGKEIRDLVAHAMGPAPVIGGGVKGTLMVSGTVGRPRAAGDIELANLSLTQTHPACPEPKQRTLALGNVKVNAAWEAPHFTGKPVTGSLANGSLTTNATATLESGVRVDLADLAIKGLVIEKVLVDFLCEGYAVTGPTDVSGALGVRLGDLWHTLNGQGQLKIGPGRVVGSQALSMLGNLTRVGGAVSSVLGGDSPKLGSSPLEYDSITSTYTITNGVVSTRDFLLSGRSLTIAAAGTYVLASGAMNLDVTVGTGRTEIKGKVTGSGSSPSIRVAPPAALREVDPAKVEKGLQDLLKKFR